MAVVAGDQGDYYVSASLDGLRPGAFFGRVGSSRERSSMPTLAYRVAVPGHHFQIAIAQESDLPLFRNVLGFTGYAGGWALYAEQWAYDLGWYEGDPYGNLGRLRDQAFRAARLVVDTGLHGGHAKDHGAPKASKDCLGEEFHLRVPPRRSEQRQHAIGDPGAGGV